MGLESIRPPAIEGIGDKARPSMRIMELDALRGIAAVAVVIYHFTYNFDRLYHFEVRPVVFLRYGRYGVFLFFIISGFVIFMTLERVRRPLDFVRSRFARLYPAYWASLLLTFSIVSWLGLPDWEIRPSDLAVNLTMWQEFLGFPHVDVVYWTLQQELYFYTLIFGLACLGGLRRIRPCISGLLIVGAIFLATGRPQVGTIGWKVSEFLLIGGNFHLFAIGVLLYRQRAGLDAIDLALLGCCLGYSAATAGLVPTAAVAFLAAMVYAATTNRLGFLANPPLLFLGTISYTLYLVHENIGYAMMRRMLGAGWGVNSSILVTSVVVVLLATAVTYLVEKPALRWLSPRRHSSPKLLLEPSPVSVAEPVRGEQVGSSAGHEPVP